MKNEPSQDPAPGARGGGAPASPNLGGPVRDALPVEEGWGSKDLIALGAPSPATRHGAQGGRLVSYFCDVHRKARDGEGFRITYTTDGVTFRHIDDFTDIPVNAGDKLFVDVLPLHHTDGVIELLRCGVEVYYLRRLTLIKKKREELKLSKSTRGDIKVLMSIEERWFRRVSEDFLTLRRMISAYRSLFKTHQQLLNKQKALSEAEKNTLEPAIKSLEVQMDEMAKKIAEEAGRRYPAYNRLIEALGIAGNTTAMEALAEVLIYPQWCSWMKTRNFFGLWKRDKKTFFHKSRTARQALERLTITIKGYAIKSRDLEDVLKVIWLAIKTQKAGPPA